MSVLLKGICSDSPNGYSCSCSFGFTGIQCNVPIVACNSQPCLNNATCYDFSGVRYLCVCPTGYNGIQF